MKLHAVKLERNSGTYWGLVSYVILDTVHLGSDIHKWFFVNWFEPDMFSHDTNAIALRVGAYETDKITIFFKEEPPWWIMRHINDSVRDYFKNHEALEVLRNMNIPDAEMIVLP